MGGEGKDAFELWCRVIKLGRVVYAGAFAEIGGNIGGSGGREPAWVVWRGKMVRAVEP